MISEISLKIKYGILREEYKIIKVQHTSKRNYRCMNIEVSGMQRKMQRGKEERETRSAVCLRSAGWKVAIRNVVRE